MADEKQIAIIEQHQVDFYGDEVIAVIGEDGTVYVPLKPICELLGINWPAQRRRTLRDVVLSDELMSVVITATNIDPSSRRPRTSTMIALPLKYLNGWLFGLNPERVKRDDVRQRIIRYQRDCYDVLYRAFQKQEVVAAPTFEDLDIEALLQRGNDPEAQAYRTAMAVANMARQQLILRYQMELQEQRLQAHEEQLGDHNARLDQIEARLGNPERYITVDQATYISQAVKTVSFEMGKNTGRNEFPGVYGELYRRFRIPSYHQLPAAKFDEAVDFLRQWYESLTDFEREVPF